MAAAAPPHTTHHPLQCCMWCFHSTLSCAMSALTIILRVFAVLTTLLGCNIYKYSAEAGKFKRRRRLQRVVTLMHCIWFRPWLFLAIYLYIRWLIDHLLQAISSGENRSYGLMMVYFVSGITIKYQNILISVVIVYFYKYYKNQVQFVLNQFVTMYREIIRLKGSEPRISWWLFFVYLTESLEPAIRAMAQNRFSRIPYVGDNSPVNTFLSSSALLFVSLQPFILSMLVHLGFLLLYSFYQQQLHLRPCHTAAAYQELLQHYKALMKLRQNFELLLRPFVWCTLICSLNGFSLSFHVLLFDLHNIRYWLYSIAYFLLYPLCFLHQSAAINLAEQEFGNQLLSFGKQRRKQRQLQVFCLYKLVLFRSEHHRNGNIFLLNRSHILECFHFSWLTAMFVNSLLVNAPASWLDQQKGSVKH